MFRRHALVHYIFHQWTERIPDLFYMSKVEWTFEWPVYWQLGYCVEMQQSRSLFLGSNEGKEHVEGDLNTVDKDKSVLGGDELEVDSMDKGPYLPRSLACR